MPELPEVETTRLGLQPHVQGQRIIALRVRNPRLRWPVPKALAAAVKNQVVTQLDRRGKYLLFRTAVGTMLVHLGMSGSLRVLTQSEPYRKHDHVEIQLQSGSCIRLHDPRRFGAVLWTTGDPSTHERLQSLGPEPLLSAFSGRGLFACSRGRKQALKQFIMDSKVVVGVGNIYANEALFDAGIHPCLPAGELQHTQCVVLVKSIKKILRRAIKQGGTTLRDFVNSEGKPGYFQQTLQVYGRGGEHCRQCQQVLQEIRLGQRSTVFCPTCQS